MILSRSQIQCALAAHQMALRLGQRLPSLSELAVRAGIHRDTLYQALSGRRISTASQARLSAILTTLDVHQTQPSRLMHVHIGSNGPALRFGIGPVGAVKR